MASPPIHHPRSGRFGAYLAWLCLALLLVSACDCADETEPESSAESASESGAAPSIAHHDHSDVELAEPVDDDRITLSYGTSKRFLSCREIFEDDTGPTAWPVSDEDLAATIFGCNPDGYLELSEGRRAIAYEIPGGDDTRATDLRIVVYTQDGELKWHHRLDRSHQSEHFAANYRGASLTNVDDSLLCATTRWHDSTQALCARLHNGHITFDGLMNFWAGLDPFGFDGSLFAADTDGITRRYPYSGTEMRHRSFEARGGRSAFYATDTDRLFFVPPTVDHVLSAWDLSTLRPIWRAELSTVPHPGYGPTSAAHGLLVFLVDETLMAVDTESGELRLALDVGDRPPPVAFSDDELFVFIRRDDQDPMIYAIDAKGGTINWVGQAPPGTLDISYGDGQLLTRSVRTVRTVEPEYD